mgnify:CR=1 FL=1
MTDISIQDLGKCYSKTYLKEPIITTMSLSKNTAQIGEKIFDTNSFNKLLIFFIKKIISLGYVLSSK